jgi:transmembrane sensor
VIRALIERLGIGRGPATADEWLARSKSMQFTPADKIKLEAWLAADSRRREEYERCLRVSALGVGLRERPDLVATMPLPSQFAADRAAGKTLATSRARAWLLPAGAAAAALVLSLLVVPRFGGEERTTMAATRHGEQRELPLPDGSRVYLNTDSAIQVAFSGGERRVRLTRGEGFFDVAREAGRPFVVEAGATEVRVVGTRFSVRSTEHGTDVIVSEGKVEVVPDTRAQTSATPAKVELVPGNALRVDRLENFVKIAAVDPERATSWRTGTIRFENASVAEVIAEVNRYAKTPFVIADESRLKDIRLSGAFKVADIESVRFVLKNGYGLDVFGDGGQIVIR